MTKSVSGDRLVATTDGREFFQEIVSTAIDNRNLVVSDDATVYVINLLADFMRADRLFDYTEDGYLLRPLALLYGDAAQAQTHEERLGALRRLGDVALFIAGLFSDSLCRSAIDVDYYISMGGSAYGNLSVSMGDSIRGRSLTGIFRELSEQFTNFVDVLAEVGEQATPQSAVDILRLYELWALTGSPRAARRLQCLGIQLAEGALAEPKH